MAFTKQARPTSNFTKAARALSGRIAKFGIAKFGQAKYGQNYGYKVPRPTSNFTKQARP